ncbi:MAG: PQQ-binding-like beta-propeller repeat protein [Acidobacteriota bacterium]
MSYRGMFPTDRREFLKRVGSLGALSVLGPGAVRGSQTTSPPAPGLGTIHWSRYGYNLQNTRFNPHENILGKDNVERLKMKWQFDVDVPIETTPVVIGELLFLGVPGAVYALNTRTGERKWKYEMASTTARGQRRAPAMGRGAQYYEGRLYFGDSAAVMHCLDAATGKQIWTQSVQVDTDKTRPVRIHSACAAFDGKIYVGTVGQMNRALCLDADTGAIRWQFWVTGTEYPGGGGSIWTGPGVDEQYGNVYFTTGSVKVYKPEGSLYTESILALDADTGVLKWFYQIRPNDPHDLDFSSCPVLYDAEAPPLKRGAIRQCLVAINKTGVYCMNRFTGEQFWRAQLTQKYHFGGPTVDGISVAYNKVYVVSNAATQSIGKPPLSVTAALHGYTGDIVWWTYNLDGISQGGIAVANGLLYQGFNDGRVQILDTDTGRQLWEYSLPTSRRAGFTVAEGTLYCSSGVAGGTLDGGRPGMNSPEMVTKFLSANRYSLYAFSPDGQ